MGNGEMGEVCKAPAFTELSLKNLDGYDAV